MPAPATLRRLSTTDLEHIRETLASGRKPKVVFTQSAGQIAGQVGQVVKLADPNSSEEWIVVRFGRDELPFAPADLAMPPKASAAKRTEPKGPTILAPAPEIPPREAAPAKGGVAKVPQAKPASKGLGPKPTADQAAQPAIPAVKPAVKPAAVRPGKSKAPASLTVTLSYADKEWTVAASQGSKVLARPYVIKPAEALRIVSMVDVPGVPEAVEAIIAAERAEAEDRAQRLRAELAEIESRLSELASRD